MPDWLVEKMRVQPKLSQARHNGHDAERDIEVAVSALNALGQRRCDNYDDWLKVGMSLHSVDSSPKMLAEWDRWSRGEADKYRDGECLNRWQSFNGDGGLKIGTLVKWAQDDSPGRLMERLRLSV